MNRLLPLFLILCALAAPAQAANRKPAANAGPDQTVPLSTAVRLDGSQSADSDGRIKKYSWRQAQGQKVKLANANTAAASFTSPAKPGLLAFKLVVTDNKGATAADAVAITVTSPPACVPPQILENNACVTPPPACVPPQIAWNGTCVDPPQPTCEVPQVLQGGVCVSPRPECPPGQIAQNGVCAAPVTGHPFNDSGIAYSADGHAGQDGEFGRDAWLNDDSDGHAGFSFTKIAATGEPLPASAPAWACVLDNVTGLMWEVKTDDGGPRDKDALYTHYSEGYNPGGRFGSASDAAGFVKAVNAAGLCGKTDWRLPTVDELQGIVDYGHPLPGPAIDTGFFPHASNALHWTATSQARSAVRGWGVYFDDGRVFGDDDRDRPSAVRLVRTEALRATYLLLPQGATASGAYIISADGQEVTDSRTGLVWRRCVEGMAWNGTTCAGSPFFGMWQHALQLSVAEARRTGQAWRLPNVKELASLLDRTPIALAPEAMAIDPVAFPATPNFQAWSSSPWATDAFYAWSAHFYHGSVYFTYLEDNGVARLVRDAR